jgi:hypothetical protein
MPGKATVAWFGLFGYFAEEEKRGSGDIRDKVK